MSNTQAKRLVDALNGTFGRHPGCRASHAKGIGVRGHFIPNSSGSGVDIPLLANPQPVSARFSIGGGKPGISDKSPTVRGMGLRIGEGDGCWALAMISAPVFFANSAEQFIEFLAARKPDPALGGPNPDRVKAFNAANPNTVPHQAYLASTPPCRCYSTEQYHSGHAYRFADGEQIIGRLMLDPVSGRQGLSENEQKSLSDDFLFDALASSLNSGPARWALKIILANDGDDIGDPTVPWTGNHPEHVLGMVEISQIDRDDASDVYDPSAMPLGVQSPKDDVFGLRSAAYAESYKRRQA